MPFWSVSVADCESCLAEARQVGFQGIELGHKFPREAGVLRATLAPFGLACVSGWYSAALLRRDAEAELTALGAFAWCTILTAIGYLLGRNEGVLRQAEVQRYVSRALLILLPVLAVIVGGYTLRRRRRMSSGE